MAISEKYFAQGSGDIQTRRVFHHFLISEHGNCRDK
jgi:hypothetical protein